MMRRSAVKIGILSAAALGVVAAGVACGNPPPSVVAVPFTVEIAPGLVRPAGSTVGIVGNHSSLGATAAKPEGDPLKALKLRQTPDAKWVGAAWLPPDGSPDSPDGGIKYKVYMLNPAAPELEADGGVKLRNVVWPDTEPHETPRVAAFDVPTNIVRPCVTFKVTVPANTPAGDTIYIAGNDDAIAQWSPGEVALTKNADDTWGGRFCFDTGKDLQYKYMRSVGDWSKVEKNADGSERANRTLTVTDDVTRNDTIEKWADL